MSRCVAFVALALILPFSACGRSGDQVPGSDRRREILLEQAAHAARCRTLTSAVAAIPDSVRDASVDERLTQITPALAARWESIWTRAARDVGLSESGIAGMLRRANVTIRSEAELDDLADEAIECGIEVDVPSHF